ncbi:hypothetical protein Ancab_034584 [Ancistrocladus abbreviatus]
MGRLLDPQRILLDHSNGSKVHGSYASGEANFDANMMIILAVLLCVLICALGLNSIVRCALRCVHRMASESADETSARLAIKGLKRSALRQIPIVVYGMHNSRKMKGTDCIICLGEFEEGDKVRVLPMCCHGFHVRCIDIWLLSHSSCPTCRQSIVLDGTATSEAVDGDEGGYSGQGDASIGVIDQAEDDGS